MTDIYTGTIDESGAVNEGVAGATVELDKVFGSKHSATVKSDATGEAFFGALPTGTYKYRVSASGHDAVDGNLTVKPGVTGASEVFLSTPLVTIEWEVNETTIEDEYTIVLNATFETDVPAAVVVAEPAAIPIPDMDQGDVFYGEYTLTNHGLIQAEELVAQLPTNSADFKFELLVEPPAVLAAKEQVTIPYRVTRLRENPDGAASGGGCYSVWFPVVHCYGYACVNGQWTEDCTTMWYTAVFGTCSGGKPSPPNTSTSGGGDWWWTGGGSGSGTGWWVVPTNNDEPVPGSPACDPCEHPSLSSAEQKCCKEGKSQPSGSSVDLVTGHYEDDAVDLRVATLGHDLEIEREFLDDKWRFTLDEVDLQLLGADGVKHLGVTYAPADEEGTVLAAGDLTIEVLPAGGGYRWTNPAGDWRQFAQDGMMTSLGDRNGREVTLVRDQEGRLAQLLGDDGEVAVTYERNGAGRVTAVESWDGRRWSTPGAARAC